MLRHPVRIALIVVLGLCFQSVQALGLGKRSGGAQLGHPLNFAVSVRLDGDETLEQACVTAEVTEGDRLLPQQLVHARLERAARGDERRIRVTTRVPLNEPVVSVQLRVGCPQRLAQSYVVFVDPPSTLSQVGAVVAPDDGWSDGRADASSAATPEISPPGARAAAASPRKARSAVALPGRDAVRAVVARLAPERPSDAASRASAEPRAKPRLASKPELRRSGGPVLQLDPIEAYASMVPELKMATTLGTPSMAASGVLPALDPDLIQRVQAQERLRALETSVAQLRQDGDAKQQSLLALQARVREAESGRYANALVYGLMLLSGLLVTGVGVMVWLRHRDRRLAEGWAALAQQQISAEAAAVWPEAERVVASPVVDRVEPLPLPVEPPALLQVHVEADRAAPIPRELATAALRRPMSAEELIDLEQQVDFFVVLGQDEAAIDLLMGHVRSTGGVSPLPYLKLLEIYRRRGEAEPYERIRERFNRRFNAYTPEWGVDPAQGKTLEAYPEVLARLQATWSMPSEAMVQLETLLFRRDVGPTFDVPAYRELLFLFGTARDLAERDVPPSGVDLLLPDFEESDFSHAVLSPHDADAPLDLDVSTDRPPLSTIEALSPKHTDVGLEFTLNAPVAEPQKAQ
jgi:pilus assembly protein FimV